MIVHANVYDPSARSLFRTEKSAKAQCQTIDCSNHENCDLYKRGECTIRKGLYRGHCHYGQWHNEYGYTRRASKFRDWVSDRKEKYKDVGFLEPPKRLGVVGEYVFLPYDRIAGTSGFGLRDSVFIPLGEFTVDRVRELCLRRPQAEMGGEIESYQKEVVPLLVLHLSEVMPDLYRDLCVEYPRAKEIVDKHSNVGREAILSTVVPNVGVLTGIHGDDWVWDGEYLTMTNRSASFMLVEHSEVRIKPVDGETVKICSDSQVGGDTEFVD